MPLASRGGVSNSSLPHKWLHLICGGVEPTQICGIRKFGASLGGIPWRGIIFRVSKDIVSSFDSDIAALRYTSDTCSKRYFKKIYQ